MFRIITALLVGLSVFTPAISFGRPWHKGRDVCLYRQKDKDKNGQEREKRSQARIERHVQRLKERLNLSNEQGQKIKEILLRAHKEEKEVWQEAKERAKEIRLRAQEQIKALLTEEQKERLHKNNQQLELEEQKD